MAPDRIMRAACGALAALCIATSALAAPAAVEAPLCDPCVPPQLAKKARAAGGSSGAALRAEVERKLRARFDAAAGPSGLITRGEARAAGLGFIERHFEAIDRRGAGRVSYDDYRAFLVARGARLD